MNSKPVPNPQRLREGEHGRLLEDAQREFADELDQPAAFRRVTERLSTARAGLPRRNYWLVPAMVVLAGAVALPAIAALVQRARLAAPPVLVAEDLRDFRAKPAAATSAVYLPATEPAGQAKTRHADGNRVSGAKLNAQGASAPASSNSDSSSAPPSVAGSLEPQSSAGPNPGVVAALTATPTPAPEPADTSTAPDCLSLARGGQTRDAETCFLKRAEGSGLGAEMALYEVARLRRDVLADAVGALAALAEYRSRFPSGTLAREADMSQLELLLQLGRSVEALTLSDELLSSSASGERAAELHLLRGHVLRKAQSRYADAEHEYELAERAGARGGEVTYFRGLCLEALGRAPEAAVLFAKYLEQPQRAYAEDARRRLERLKP
jgi:tetratricopeptide (TPR) repeat protein